MPWTVRAEAPIKAYGMPAVSRTDTTWARRLIRSARTGSGREPVRPDGGAEGAGPRSPGRGRSPVGRRRAPRLRDGTRAPAARPTRGLERFRAGRPGDRRPQIAWGEYSR